MRDWLQSKVFLVRHNFTVLSDVILCVVFAYLLLTLV